MPLLPCSDKTVLVWELERAGDNYGFAKKALKGHSHFVQDVVISSDGQFCLTGSWDGTLRLWDLNTGSTTRRFVGHTKDVLSVAFSVDNRQVWLQNLCFHPMLACMHSLACICAYMCIASTPPLPS